MALLFIEGFDHMVGSTGLTTKWAVLSGNPQVQPAAARTGQAGVTLYGDMATKPLAAVGGFVFGVASKVPSLSDWTSVDFLQAREGTVVHLQLSTDANQHLVVKRGTTVLQTGTQALAAGNWYYFEFKGVIDSVAGTFEVRIDGVPDIVGTAQNTRNGGTTGQWDRMCLHGSGGNQMFDDVYVCDASGTGNNTFLGPCKVETVLPQTDAAAAGTNHSLTPSTGADHGALVDESSPSVSDYNSSSTVGAKDTYQFPTPVVTGLIFGIQTNLYVAKSDSGLRTVCHVVRAGGTDYDGPDVVPTTTFGFSSQVRGVNPATGVAWTGADLAAIEVGMKITGP